jgi:hypothetical protein
LRAAQGTAGAVLAALTGTLHARSNDSVMTDRQFMKVPILM